MTITLSIGKSIDIEREASPEQLEALLLTLDEMEDYQEQDHKTLVAIGHVDRRGAPKVEIGEL